MLRCVSCKVLTDGGLPLTILPNLAESFRDREPRFGIVCLLEVHSKAVAMGGGAYVVEDFFEVGESFLLARLRWLRRARHSSRSTCLENVFAQEAHFAYLREVSRSKLCGRDTIEYYNLLYRVESVR